MRRSLLASVLLLASCGPAPHPVDASTEAPGRDASAIDGDVETGDAAVIPTDAHDPSLGIASHERQLRGAWVPSVWNLAFPSRSGLNATQARAELTAMLDAMVDVRMNAIFFQIRPESDALYASSLEPWSRFASGTQGVDPGWDPLAMLLTEAHARGIEVHAWMNPYRGMASTSATTAATHVTRTLSAHAHRYGTQIWMDPGAPEVRAHVVEVVRDVITRYDVDGIHFDDYFYPYPIAGEAFPDESTRAAYVASGGTLSRGDWRRQNVHDLVRAVSEAITGARDDVRFGISPFGIYRPGMPSGIVGLDAYAEIYCDPLVWLDSEWVDYLAPQLYWPTTQTAQAFEPLLTWWSAQATEARPILAGINLIKLGDGAAWTLDEYRDQYRLVDEHWARHARGTIAYTIAPLVEDRDGIRGVMRAEIHPLPALPPPLPRAIGGTPPLPPTVTFEGASAGIDHPDRATVRALVIYDRAGATPTIARVLTGEVTSVDLPPGTWSITAADRRGLESAARAFTIP